MDRDSQEECGTSELREMPMVRDGSRVAEGLRNQAQRHITSLVD